MTPEQLNHVRAIAGKYAYGHDGWNKAHAGKVGYLTQRIAYQLVKQNLIVVEPTYLLLAIAIALPHDIGRNPNAVGRGEHNQRSFETLKKELEESTLGQDEITIIQYCALFHTGNEWRDITITGKPEMDKLVKTWAGILRIADGLDYGLSQRVNDVIITSQGKEILCRVITSSSCNTEINRARQKSDLLKALGLNITIP